MRIIYEDNHLIVVNKPAGLSVLPDGWEKDSQYLVKMLEEQYERMFIVHRLDKDTSGIMIVAKNGYAYQHLAAQFKNRTVTKEYLALVWGKMPAAEGVIEQAIGRHRSDRKRMSSLRALSKAREAITHWEVASCFETEAAAGSRLWVSLLRVRPQTGRTHQIRVHLADLGHPLVGDRLYGHRRRSQSLDSTSKSALASFPRQALHARKLAVDHPRTGKRMFFCAPMPDDMGKLMEDLSRSRLASKGGCL